MGGREVPGRRERVPGQDVAGVWQAFWADPSNRRALTSSEAQTRYERKLATSGDPLRQVELQSLEKDATTALTGEPLPQVVVVTRPVSSALAEALKIYVEQGGTLVLAPQDQEAASRAQGRVVDIRGYDDRDQATVGFD